MNTPVAAVPKTQGERSCAPDKRGMSAEEQRLRAAAMAGANGHNAMEGFFGSPILDSLQARYLAGEIDIRDAIHELKRNYALSEL